MELVAFDAVDIALDENGQPKTDAAGNILTASGTDLIQQDVWCEALTEEGELPYEDEEDRWAYGFGLREFLNGDLESLQDEVIVRVREKLTKRDYVDADSIEAELTEDKVAGRWILHVRYRLDGSEEEIEEELELDEEVDL